MRRIGIYGGAFNPPHNGHINAVKAALEALELDEVIVIPTGTSPHKELPKGSPTSGERLEMTKLAFEDMEHVFVSDVEMNRTGPSYTADTLTELHDLYPESEFWLITGADMFLSMQSWWHPEEIFAQCGVCALSRKEGESEELRRHSDFLFERYGAECVIIENDIIDISSTEVRSAVANGEADKWVPVKVLKYIDTKGLYDGHC